MGWERVGNLLFVVHALSVMGIFSTLFYLIFNHRFEYFYVWSHSSKQLPFKYLLSCFWEGQEGSFLLWSIWHSVLGLLVLRKKSEWRAPVMAVVAICQAILATTLLGYYFGSIKIGSSPFILLREQMVGAPIFQNPDYLSMIPDPKGLNPLLQNYWMVIHPPVLFLGFASTLFPFAYSIAAMWRRTYDQLTPHLLKWSVFSGMILGLGIMMGGAWAYESLSFGGYWAWDPVENASLVPWLVMVAGLHTTMIYKSTGYSLKSTLLFFIFSFALVLYSTFLTRTGILGDTSVHAFTGEGSTLFNHLLFFLFFFLLMGLILFITRYKSIPDLKKEEEALSSREFWMFIGALILMISVVQITYTTSMPVWNKIFGSKLTITNPVEHYNKIQIWISVLVLLGTASIYYFKFKSSPMREVLRKLSIPFFVAIAITVITSIIEKFQHPGIIALLFTSWFTILANLNYVITVLKGKAIKWGGSVAHIGFGLMLLGMLFSGYNKEVISMNQLGSDLGIGQTPQEKAKENRENVLLYKDMSIFMRGYEVTYLGDTVNEPNHYYKVRYRKMENDTGRVLEEFILYPNAQINPSMGGLISNPDSRHYITHDIFTYISSATDKNKLKDTTSFTTVKMKMGDSLTFANGTLVLEGITNDVGNRKVETLPGDILVNTRIAVLSKNGDRMETHPLFIVRNNQVIRVSDTLVPFNLITRVDRIIPEENSFELSYKLPDSMREFITMKAILFPYINVLWLGTLIMVVGFGISLLKRIRLNT